MRVYPTALLAVVQLAIASIAIDSSAQAQGTPRRLAVKNGETVQIGTIYWTVNCRSTMTAPAEVEVLEGPAEVTLSIKEAQVLPRRNGCAKTVPGGLLMLTAKDVTEPSEAKLTYRIKYKTKDGDRQIGGAYVVSLFP